MLQMDSYGVSFIITPEDVITWSQSHMLHDKRKLESRIILVQLINIAESEFRNDSKRAIVAWMISLNS